MACAIANCGNELSKMLGQCLGCCKRANALFGKFGQHYIVEGPYANVTHKQGHGLLCSFVNVFGN